MPTVPAFVLLLWIGLAKFVVAIIIADPDDFSPLLPAPFWQSNGSTLLIVNSTMEFDLGTSNSSSILQGATERYQRTIFGWGSGGRDPETLPCVSFDFVNIKRCVA